MLAECHAELAQNYANSTAMRMEHLSVIKQIDCGESNGRTIS